MNLLDLLSAFLEPLLDLFPRIARRPASNEWMVVDRWFRGVRVRTSPVLHVPFITHVEYLPKYEMPIDCGLQRVTSADGKNIAVNATALVVISDPVLCRDRAGEEYEETISLLIRSVVCDLVSGHNWSHIQDMITDNHGYEEIEDNYEEIEDNLQHFGIDLITFRIEDLQEVFPVSLLQ
jgi:regulator of protease activity HflC (stomatin/prohibitin superfamily)